MSLQKLQPSFSNLQLELLKLYANGISDEQLQEVKWLLGRYFADKATEKMDSFIAEKNLTPSDILQKASEHHRAHRR
ncbi:hypothetical protein HRG84_09260 [Flavisolibacter sp. BT320]|nr:hypothetical protein [Flavisolibacter longurius]